MRFCHWYPLTEAAAHAPAEPGLYQIKLPRVIDYPTGKSAMIRYGAASDVRGALVLLAEQNRDEPWLCRHAEELDARTAAAPDAALAELLDKFRRRFGMEPTPPGTR